MIAVLSAYALPVAVIFGALIVTVLYEALS